MAGADLIGAQLGVREGHGDSIQGDDLCLNHDSHDYQPTPLGYG